MKKEFFKIICFASALCLSEPLMAAEADLSEVYRQAACSDSIFRAAWSTMFSTQEAVPQSFAGILPTLSATGYDQGSITNTTAIAGFGGLTPDQIAAGQRSPLGINRFNTNNYTINLSQPLFNATNWFRIGSSIQIHKAALAIFCDAAQELIIRVATAYFDVLLAQDNLIYTHAQQAANYEALYMTEERYKAGLDTLTSVYNAKASYDTINSQEITAENTLRNNLEVLQQITGRPYCSIEGLKIEIPLLLPCPFCAQEWVNASTQNNKKLESKRYEANAAQENIKVFFGGHLPTVSAIASYGRTSNQYQTYTQGSAGVQINVPIYQGGYVSSQVRQAQDDYSTAVSEMETAYREATTKTRQSFNDVLSGITRIEADRITLISSKNSVQTTIESFKVGTRTIVDVLIAQQQLYQTRLNYSKDQYTYLLDTLKLKRAAGILCPKDLVFLNCWLHGPNQREIYGLEKSLATQKIPEEMDMKELDEDLSKKIIPITEPNRRYKHIPMTSLPPSQSPKLAAKKRAPNKQVVEKQKHTQLVLKTPVKEKKEPTVSMGQNKKKTLLADKEKTTDKSIAKRLKKIGYQPAVG